FALVALPCGTEKSFLSCLSNATLRLSIAYSVGKVLSGVLPNVSHIVTVFWGVSRPDLNVVSFWFVLPCFAVRLPATSRGIVSLN
ncbi:MAG TPA: hypothetical protein PLD47_14565, partial [Aggregatilineales bacterium]|nr:hypothetical protein [Aggregatilineales bacterium]